MSSVLVPIVSGWALGYGVNYLADALPASRRLTWPACSRCGTRFPLLSYLVGGKCATCGKSRAARMWLVILSMTAFAAYIWSRPLPKLGFALSAALAAYFAVVLVIDLEHRLIMHAVSAVGAALGLTAGWILHGPILTLTGGLLGFLIMLALYGLGVLFSRYRAGRLAQAGIPPDNEEALGAGDVILAGVLGLILGLEWIGRGLLLGILLGGLTGAILVLIMVISRRYGKQALMLFMPYGPFFVLSAFYLTFFPNWIVAATPR